MIKKQEQTLQLPIITVPQHKEFVPFAPTADDLESGIIKMMQNETFVLNLAGKHQFMVEPEPPILHNQDKTKHSVYWVNRSTQVQGNKDIQPWQANGWNELASDGDFLRSADEYFACLQQDDPFLRVYHLYGFAHQHEKDAVADLPTIAPRAAQTQYRPHVHMNSGFSLREQRGLELSGVLRWQAITELMEQSKLVQLFTNAVGERMVALAATYLNTFGTKVEYQQYVGKENAAVPVERTTFGFATWQEALSATIELEKRIEAEWLSLALAATREPALFGGVALQLVQGCRFSAGLLRPSELDRAIHGFSAKYQWLVTPCSVAIPHLLVGPAHVLVR